MAATNKSKPKESPAKLKDQKSREQKSKLVSTKSISTIESRFLLPESLQSVGGSAKLAAIISSIYGIILFAVAIIYHKVGDFGVETDFFWGYAPHAREIQQIITGNGGTFPLDPFHGPMYSIALAFVGFIIRDLFTAGVTIAVLSASGTLFVTHRLIARFFGNAQAFFVMLILATNSIFIQYSYSAGTDMFFNLLATLAVYFALKSFEVESVEADSVDASKSDSSKQLNLSVINSSSINAALAGLFSALSYLTRQNAIFLVVGFLFILFAINPARKNLKAQFISAASFLIVLTLALIPWAIFTKARTGVMFYNENHLNIARDLFGKDTNWDAFWAVKAKEFKSLGDVILADPAKFFQNIFSNIPQHFIKDQGELMSWWLGAFVILGIVVTLFSRSLTRIQFSFFIFTILHFGILLLVFYGSRFSLNLIGAYAMLVILFFSWKGLPNFSSGISTMSFVLYIAVLIAGFNSFSFNRKQIDAGPQELVLFREKFFEVTKNSRTDYPTELICTRKPHIAHYLNLKMFDFPYVETYDELIAACKKSGVKYLYYSYIEAQMRPQFQFLFNLNSPPPDLEPVMYLQNPPAVLYKIK